MGTKGKPVMTFKSVDIHAVTEETGQERLGAFNEKGQEIPGILQIKFLANASNGFSPMAEITQLRGVSFKGDASVLQKIILSSAQKTMLLKVAQDPKYPKEYQEAAKEIYEQGV
jgi:hypothetical protein